LAAPARHSSRTERKSHQLLLEQVVALYPESLQVWVKSPVGGLRELRDVDETTRVAQLLITPEHERLIDMFGVIEFNRLHDTRCLCCG